MKFSSRKKKKTTPPTDNSKIKDDSEIVKLKEINQNDVVILSSEDEDYPIKFIKKKTTDSRNFKVKLEEKIHNDNFNVEDKNIYKTPAKNNNVIKEENTTVRRKISNNTNLRKISIKDHPSSQTKLDSFFTRKENPNSVRYFDIFEKSNKPSPAKTNSTDVTDVKKYVEIVIHENENSPPLEIKSDSKSIGQVNSEKIIGDSISTALRKSSKTTVGESDSVKHYYQSKKVSKTNQKVLNYLEENKLLSSDCCNKNSSDLDSKQNLQDKRLTEVQNDLTKVLPQLTKHVPRPPSQSDSVVYSLDSEAVVQISSEKQKTVNNQSTRKSQSRKRVRKKLHYKEDEQVPINDKIMKKNSDDNLILSPNSYSTSTCTSRLDTSKTSSNDDEIKAKQTKFSNLHKDSTTDKNIDRKKRILKCPSYKIVEGTTFAVDGFRYGEIETVTHYFLSHFHGDHYIGLKKSFAMPLYLSRITAILVENFIHVSPEHLHILELNKAEIVNGIEVTALDANHCPGAVMFAFKFPNGKCILHTGDFRANPDMESESYFWNNQIDTIYLDTTYLNKNYNFKSQTESIADVRECITNFQEKHIGKRILYVCGSYVIGKEKVWQEIAEITGHRVYTNGSRLKALQAIGDSNLLKHLIYEPREANIHVVTMNELNYLKLYEYYQVYSDQFDIVLGIRPSGWETNSKPQLRGQINVIGIEYSEHSSFTELKRFICFLQPKKVISTVPTNHKNISDTPKIPEKWLNTELKPRQQSYQPTIRSYTTPINTKQNSTNDQKPMCSKYLPVNDMTCDSVMMNISRSVNDSSSLSYSSEIIIINQPIYDD